MSRPLTGGGGVCVHNKALAMISGSFVWVEKRWTKTRWRLPACSTSASQIRVSHFLTRPQKHPMASWMFFTKTKFCDAKQMHLWFYADMFIIIFHGSGNRLTEARKSLSAAQRGNLCVPPAPCDVTTLFLIMNGWIEQPHPASLLTTFPLQTHSH